MDNAVVFGAGATGRGLMGQLFTASGYAVKFVDTDAALIAALNERGYYRLALVDNVGRREVQVHPVGGLLTGNEQAVVDALAVATVGATGVGARGLPVVAALLAAGVSRRMADGVEAPLNLLICENLPDVASALRDMLEEYLGPEAKAYARTHLGLADVVIGRMIPEPSREMLEKDISGMLAEPYAEITVDGDALIGAPPRIMGMHAVSPIGPWITRKLYLHNAVHAMMGYLGYRRGLHYGYEALNDRVVRHLLETAMAESQAGLVGAYGFDAGELSGYLTRLWTRLGNMALADPVRRLARDPLRKLVPGDRLVGPARLAEAAGVPPEGLAWGIAGALDYDAPDDAGAQELQARIAIEGIGPVMLSVCNISPDEPLGQLVLKSYSGLRRGEWPA
jgi:mannitol-1-phosphate 5-dehydrogenase